MTILLSVAIYLVVLASLLSGRREQRATGRQGDAASADPLAKGSLAGDPVQSGTSGTEPGDHPRGIGASEIERLAGRSVLAKGKRRR